jgi:uncharacterized alpha-E superfamily protein
MGRRIERGVNACHLARLFAPDDASADDLTVLLDLGDSQISYRNRYLTGPSLSPVRDLLLLEPQNPRALVYQTQRMAEHIAALPTLRADGMPEEPQRLIGGLVAILAPLTGESMTVGDIADVEARLLALSDAIGERYFLQVRKVEKIGGADLLS